MALKLNEKPQNIINSYDEVISEAIDSEMEIYEEPRALEPNPSIKRHASTLKLDNSN